MNRLLVVLAAIGPLMAQAQAQAQAQAPMATQIAPALRSVAGVTMPAAWPAGATTDTYHGVTVADPFRELEDVKSPAVQQWMRAQADAAQNVMARIPGREALLKRMQEVEAAAAGAVTRIVPSEGGRTFFMRRNPGENQFKLVLREASGAERVLIDPEALSVTAGRPQAIMDWEPSPDGQRLAYSLQTSGGEIGVMHVIDVQTGRPLTAPADRIRFAGASWLDDNSGLFYSRLREGYDKLPAGERFQDRTRHFRALDGKDTDIAVASVSRNTDLGWPGFASPSVFQLPGSNMAALWVSFGVERNTALYVAALEDAKAGKAKWRKLFDREDEISTGVFRDGHFYLRSAKNAPRYRILRLALDAKGMADAVEVVPQGEGVIGELGAARDGLYFTRRDGVNTSLFRIGAPAGAMPISGAPQALSLPVQGSVEIVHSGVRREGVVLELAGWTRMAKPWQIGPDGRAQRLQLAPDGAFDAPPNIEAREVMVRGLDGVMVPLSIVSKKGLKQDGRNPTIVYGYGAYGITDDPFFNPRMLAYLERGGIFAVAHVRGGGVFGKGWHDAGKKTTKPNTWRDAIAAASWLVENKWTSPAQLGIWGGSAGGILVGRAITERPDLFAAALPSVGSMDKLRSEFQANGAANIPEFGTVKIEPEFRALLEMSSYFHLKNGTAYPAVMLQHGVNDIRVDVWQSSKFAARMQANPAQTRPVLLRLDYEAGHGSGSTRAQAQQRSADTYAFFFWQFGLPEFQPLP